MFGSTYIICESVFSIVMIIRNKNRSSLSDTSLCHLMRLSITQLDVDIGLQSVVAV